MMFIGLCKDGYKLKKKNMKRPMAGQSYAVGYRLRRTLAFSLVRVSVRARHGGSRYGR